MDTPLVFTIDLLQVPTFYVNGEIQALRSTKGAALLYYLLLEKKASRDKLAALIWGNEPPELARRHLRDTIYLFRKHVGDMITAVDRYTLQLNPAYRFECDVDALMERQDISVYQGEFLQDFHLPDSVEYENWVERRREKYRSAYLLILSERIQQAAQERQSDKLEEYLQLYLREDPTSESTCVQLMQLYQQRKEYSKAASSYQRLYKSLSDEMGIAPLKDTAALYYSIMEEWNDQAENERIRYDSSLPNRQAIYSHLEESLSESRQSRVVVVSGAPGIGKTYMLNRLLASEPSKARHIITASGYKSKRSIPFYVWQAIVSGLRQFILEEKLPIPEFHFQALDPLFPVLSGAKARRTAVMPADRYFEVSVYETLAEIIRVAARRRPLVFVFENIHWMDQASIELMDMVMRTLERGLLITLATCQSPVPDALMPFLEAAQEDHLLSLQELPPFTQEETMTFIVRHSGQPFSEETKQRIYDETQGNAFMLVQLLGYLKEHSDDAVFHLDVDSQIAFRTSGLSRESRQLLDMTAMFSEYAPYQVLCQVMGKTSLELLPACRDLTQRMLIDKRCDGGQLSLAMVRPEYRETIYAQISSFDRQVMHRTIANILENSIDEIYDREAMLEYHYQQAGDPVNAFRHRVNGLAAYVSGAYDIFSVTDRHDEFSNATDSYVQGVVLELENTLDQLQQDYNASVQLDEIRKSILYITSIFGISTGNYSIGLPAAYKLILNTGKNDRLHGIGHRQIANYAIQTYNLELLDEHITASQECARLRGDEKMLAALERYRGLLYLLQGNYPLARDTLKHGLELVEQVYSSGIDHDAHVSYSHNYIGDTYRKEGLYEQACAEYQLAIDIIQRWSNMTGRPVFHTNYGWTLLAMGRYAQAKENFEWALQCLGTVRTSFVQSLASSFAALFACAEGDHDRSVSLLQSADRKMEQFRSPRDRGISALIKAVIRKHLDETGEDDTLSRMLDRPYAYYASEVFLYGKLGVFERDLLNNLFSSKGGREDLLFGLWNGA